MMQQRPVIAILTANNVLVGVGLLHLEKVPGRRRGTVRQLSGISGGRSGAVHPLFRHGAALRGAQRILFRARPQNHRLASGQTPAGVHCIDVQTDEERFSALAHATATTASADRNTPCPSSRRLHAAAHGREAEVLTLIAGGLIEQAGRRPAGNRPDDRDLHRRNIMEKLGIRTAAGLVVYALAAGYVDPDGM